MRIVEQMLLDAHPSDSGLIDCHAREVQGIWGMIQSYPSWRVRVPWDELEKPRRSVLGPRARADAFHRAAQQLE